MTIIIFSHSLAESSKGNIESYYLINIISNFKVVAANNHDQTT